MHCEIDQRLTATLRRLPPDHLAVLLSLVAHALSSEDKTEHTIGRELFTQALAPWLSTFGEALSTRSTTPLYRAVGVLLAHVGHLR